MQTNKNIKRIEIDANSNFAVYVKNQNTIPHYLVYEKMKSIFDFPGLIYVPNHMLFRNNDVSFLLIEGVIYNKADAKKWYETKPNNNNEEYFYELTKSFIKLMECITKSPSITHMINPKEELEEIFTNYPSSIDIDYYKDCFYDVYECLGNINIDKEVEERYLVQRDFYNNILVGAPWGKLSSVKTKVPFSIIDFGETYKYTSIFEVIAEIIVIWKNKSIYYRNNHDKFLSIFINALKKNSYWNSQIIKLYMIIWEVKNCIWEDRKSNNKTECVKTEIRKIANSL